MLTEYFGHLYLRRLDCKPPPPLPTLPDPQPQGFWESGGHCAVYYRATVLVNSTSVHSQGKKAHVLLRRSENTEIRESFYTLEEQGRT